jgi:hypothetical protein
MSALRPVKLSALLPSDTVSGIRRVRRKAEHRFEAVLFMVDTAPLF